MYLVDLIYPFEFKLNSQFKVCNVGMSKKNNIPIYLEFWWAKTTNKLKRKDTERYFAHPTLTGTLFNRKSRNGKVIPNQKVDLVPLAVIFW